MELVQCLLPQILRITTIAPHWQQLFLCTLHPLGSRWRNWGIPTQGQMPLRSHLNRLSRQISSGSVSGHHRCFRVQEAVQVQDRDKLGEPPIYGVREAR